MRAKVFLTTAVWLAACVPSYAGALTIKGPALAAPYSIVRLTAEGDLAGAALIWDVDREDVADVEEGSGGRLLLTGPPGVYKIKCRSIRLTKDGPVIETARLTVIIGPAPGPGPGPGPAPPPPTPPPTPTVKNVWAIIVVDNDARTPELGRLLDSVTLWKAIEAGGNKWRVLDVKGNAADISAKNYAGFISQAGGAPCILLLGMDGKLLKAVKLPADEAGVLNLIKEVTGK